MERMESKKKMLLNSIYEARCIKFGEYKLKSGIMSPVYVDFRGLVSHPDTLGLVGINLGRAAKDIEFDKIAGIPYTGIPLGVAMALLDCNQPRMIYPRKEVKEHGTAKKIEGEFEPGERVLVIDDVITDGASKIDAIEPLKEAGLTVTDILVVLDREQGGDKIMARAGYKLHSVFKLTEVVDELAQDGKITLEIAESVKKFLAEHQFV